MDAENSTKPVEYLQGFAELSEFFGSSPELAHFRRFDVLGARNLLYLQAQLLAIETRLKHYDNEDLRKWKELGKDDEYAMRIEQAARDWISFQNLSARDKHQAEKIQLVFELRKAMKEYQEALVLHSKILSLPSPNNFLVAILKKWFDRNQPFVYHGADLFDRSRDLVSLKSTVDQDALSRGMQATFGYFFKESREVPESWGDVYFYREQSVAKLVSIISVLIATVLLFGAICCLSFISPSTLQRRIAIIGSFTAAFAVTVGILTNAKRAELFTAVAGYSAVLVVFAAANTNG